MSKTNFSGPVYGAKSLLWSPSALVVSSGGSTVQIKQTVVPTYEDWYITEAVFSCSSCSTGAVAASSVAQFQFKANGSTLHAPAVIQDTNSVTLISITPDGGEYEGKRIPAGSTLRLVGFGGSSAVPIGSLSADLRGYIRWINSSAHSEG